MPTKPVTASASRGPLATEIDAGAAGAPPSMGADIASKAAVTTRAAKAGQAAPTAPKAKAVKGARPQVKSGAPTGAGSAVARSVDKALGKTSAPPASSASPAAQKSTAGYAASATNVAATGEWAFLQDKGTSIEDKLVRFLMLVQKKNDAELVKKMEEYKSRFTTEGKAASTGGSKGQSLFDLIKGTPFLGAVAGLVGEAGLKKAVTQLGGPVLAAAATALGMPQLAPLALKYGGDLAGLAFQDLGKSAGSTSSTAAASGSPDERLAMFELQRLAEKQQAMFTAISNTLKCMHDTQMSAIHNIR